jgi:hypothetical protein
MSAAAAVPGWYSTYWITMLSDIEVRQFWTTTAYTISDTPNADIETGSDRRVHDTHNAHESAFLRNEFASGCFGAGRHGDIGARHRLWRGLRRQAGGLFQRRGTTWRAASLGKDAGEYSFRRWEARFTPTAKGSNALMVRCTNSNGVTQPDPANWNPTGYIRNVGRFAVWRRAIGVRAEISYRHVIRTIQPCSPTRLKRTLSMPTVGVSLDRHGPEPAGAVSLGSKPNKFLAESVW